MLRSESAPERKSADPTEPDVVLSVRDVYRFHEVDGRSIPILRGVSFDLPRQTFAAVMGPSGSGKSTLLHIVAGMDLPSSGEVLLGDIALTSLSEAGRTRERRRRIGFIFQFFHLLPDLTVRENVGLPLLIAGDRVERHVRRVDEILDSLGLLALADRLPAQLSGGEMQRASIARALVTEPPILLCDEPTGNLASKAGEEIIATLRRIVTERNTAVLLVTHNPRDAAAADRVMFLRDGAMAREHDLSGPGLSLHQVHARLEELQI
ncbi:MAG: ABC transporter ATP-binding protein [Planctomycetota bacterium]